MTIPLTALAAKPVPAFCTSGHGVLSAQQWKTCWNAGWQLPTDGAANAGAAIGHGSGPVLFVLIAAVIALLVASRLGRSGRTATN